MLPTITGDLHNKSFLAHVGEEYGSGLGKDFGLRDMDEDLKISDVSAESHDLSRVFSGAIYDVLVNIFEITRQVPVLNNMKQLDVDGSPPASAIHLREVSFIKGGCSLFGGWGPKIF